MIKTVACIIARTNSSRLPKKVLRKVNTQYTLIEYLIQKTKQAKNIDEIYLCTSIDEDDAVLLDIARKNNIKVYAGSRDSVIERLLAVADIEQADNVVRITGDNIFTDECYLDLMIEAHKQHQADYTRTEYLPIGITPEVMAVEALKKCVEKINPDYTQYLMLYMFQPDHYKCVVLLPSEEERQPNWSLTVDTPEDWERTLYLIKNTKAELISYKEILELGQTQNVPYLLMEKINSIKFPAGVELSFEAYRTEMENRMNRSIKINIE